MNQVRALHAPHQLTLFTRDALQAIADTTLQNLKDIEQTGACANDVATAAPSG